MPHCQCPERWALPFALLALASFAGAQTPTGNTGVVFSEMHFFGAGMANLPSYVELVNLDLTNAANIGGMRLVAVTPQGTFVSNTFPPGSMIPPAAQGGVAIVASAPLSGVPAPNLQLPPDPSFFAPSVLNPSPNNFTRLCLIAAGGSIPRQRPGCPNYGDVVGKVGRLWSSSPLS